MAERTCSIDDCERPARGGGLCQTHYMRRWRGDLKLGTPVRQIALVKPDACEVDGCERPVKARGYCSAHYTSLLRRGDPLAAKSRVTLAERLWAKVDCDGPLLSPYLGPCWLWTAGCDEKGYGRIERAGAGSRKAHRVAYEIVRGAIPVHLEMDHLCRVRRCVNPAHLEPVTHAENCQRR